MSSSASIFVAGLGRWFWVGVLAGAVAMAPVMPGFASALVPDDAQIGNQWHLDQIQAYEAWDTRTNADDIVVAIIDGGVYYSHPDLLANIWNNPGEVMGDGIDNDRNGYVDDVVGWDYVDDDEDPSPDPNADEVSETAMHHGTVVAGIIGAIGDNGIGIAGINWGVQMMILRALDSVGEGNAYDVSDAIYYAVENGADVINLSLTGYESAPALETAIEYAYANEVVVVAAMGNENIDTDITTVYPACLRLADLDYVIGVTATDFDDQKADFSNYGSECSDISAPGVAIFSTIYEDLEAGYLGAYMDGWTGTSFASPMVAGAVAMLLAEYPSLTPSQVQLALELGADPLNLGPTYRGKLGTGRLNLDKALDIGAVYSEQNGEGVQPLYIRGMSLPDVYQVIDGKRYVFMNATTYFTYEETFDPIQFIPDSELSQYAFGGVMVPKSGTVLIKVQSVPKVYALEDRTLRHIADEELAIRMYGEHWSDYVIDVPSAMMTLFDVGMAINVVEDVDTSILLTREELASRMQ